MRFRTLLALGLSSTVVLAQETPPAPEAAEHWLRDQLPEWLLRETVVLENWQWIALVAVAIAGVVTGAIFRYVAIAIAARVSRAHGAEVRESKRRGKPFATLGQGVVWVALLPFVELPEGWFHALDLAARGVAMLGMVWAACRVVDWISVFLVRVAANTDTGLDDLLVPMITKGIKVVIVAIGVVWIADNLGMNVAALVTGLGIGGVAVALASKDTVENLFGTASILADRPFQVGDWIRLGNVEGTVERVGFRTTRVRTFYNSLITFPNAILIRSSVDNMGARKYRRIKQTLGVAYDTPPDTLEAFVEGIREIVRRHPYTRKDYYHVYLTGFGDSALEILLYVFVETPEWATELREKQRLLLDIVRLANKLGVEFAFPTRTVHLIPSQQAEHGAEIPIDEARRAGRREAGDIVDTFTGPERPPPVQFRWRPDGALDDDDG